MFWVYLLIIVFSIFPGIIIFDYSVIQKLNPENKFKKWWRKYLVADYNDENYPS
jgi:hypothetical protein